MDFSAFDKTEKKNKRSLANPIADILNTQGSFY